MRCLPIQAGANTLVLPMQWVMSVHQVSDQLSAPPTEGEPTLPLLDVSAWVGTPSQTARRFAVIVGSAEHRVCLLVDGVLPARTADAFTRLPGTLQGTPFTALWEPDPAGAPLPVLDVQRLLNAIRTWSHT